MQTESLLLLILVAAYCLGSISFAVVVSRLMRLPDPRSYGSKNPGATNVLRTGRKVAAALTLAGDAGKGWLAVWLAWFYTLDMTVAALLAWRHRENIKRLAAGTESKLGANSATPPDPSAAGR